RDVARGIPSREGLQIFEIAEVVDVRMATRRSFNLVPPRTGPGEDEGRHRSSLSPRPRLEACVRVEHHAEALLVAKAVREEDRATLRRAGFDPRAQGWVTPLRIKAFGVDAEGADVEPIDPVSAHVLAHP